ncbi:proprotein convertase P-domain-containing protein [Streptomyces sp. DT2A-34]|uniref:proprotein convertase P-domain-containing protein n=1 Tax=Streptomyces sp. DT2A-34 TaxID=3051182 RepID=UPI00265BA6EF|nr:proprotein convertase P-domain-containing protein [Streptomyces sp. DT2A-34]MDO0914525.1 proprotein convertase P-domain-containing protein [Streptomyces sp. DT2A-34]
MKRPIWAAVTATAAAVLFSALPANTNPLTGTSTATADETGPVDAALFDKTADGSTIRVNVLTDQRTDISGAAEAGTTLVSYDTVPLVTLRVDSAGLSRLQNEPGVVSVTEDLPVPPTLNESTVKIGSDKAAAAGKTGAGATVAILDTGISAKHPFFSGRVKTEACFSSDDAAYGATTLCPDGTTDQEGPGAADTDTGPCATLGSACSHGTHVAGIAAGNGSGLTGAPTRGVAPGADIVSIQVFSKFDSDNYCGAGSSPCVLSFTSSQIKGLEKVLALKSAGVNIVAANMSLGAGRWTSACTSDPRKYIIDALLTEGVATVAAAGNNGYSDAVNAPGCVASAVTVGSTTDDDQLSTFTNRGPLLDLLAPGTSIVSSVPGGAYASKNGTSMAAPHVAGALAVLKQTYPTETIDGLVSLLATGGTRITYTGAATPRIDVAKAVTAVEPKPVADTKPRAFRVDNDKDVTIPDGVGSPAPGPSVTSPVTVAEYPGNASGKLTAYVDITHTYRGDVKLELLSPTGKVFLLKNTSGSDGADNIAAAYTVDASTEPANGQWNLRMTDIDDVDTGKLNTWSLVFPTPFEKTTTQSVPDTGTLTSTIAVNNIGGNASGPLQVYTNIAHTKIGDLRLTLTSPDSKSYVLKPYGSEPGGTLQTTYGVDATDAVADGTWTLKVSDSASGSTGDLKGWSLGFPSYENQTVKAVPDKNYTEIWTRTENLSGIASAKLQVYVHVEHQNLEDLKIDLVAPDGSLRLLKANGSPNEAGVIKKIYTVNVEGLPANGWWKLRVDDVTTGKTGTVNNFVVRF